MHSLQQVLHLEPVFLGRLKMTGAHLVVEQLLVEGVTQIFGYPGGAVIPLYDALHDYPQINHVRTTHEQHALHAADGYSRATGKVGVAIVTSGPGGTNAVTGIATAYLDSVPLVILSGQVPSALMGRDAFQEVDITGVVTPISKHTFLVKSAHELPSILHRAFKIAMEGRKGPVLIDLPKDLLMTHITDKQKIQDVNLALYTPAKRPDTALNYYQLHKITDALHASKKPIIYAGGGVIHSDASDLLLTLAQTLDAPVVNSLMGLGSFPRTHPLSLGLVGMHGSVAANLAITKADLIIAIGVRFSDRVLGKPHEFAPNATIIRIDIDPTEFGKNLEEDYTLRMHATPALQALLKRINPLSHPNWHKELALLHHPLDKVSQSIETLFKNLHQSYSDACIATDVGQHQMWTAQYYPFTRARQWLTSGGLGTMGFGLGAAIGAAVATQKRVVLITGDGSFRMNMAEMLTVKRLNLPITVVMINNGTLGMVRQWQTLFQKKRYCETDLDDGVDMCGIISAMGIPSYRVAITEQLQPKTDGPQFIEVLLDQDAGVYPIVPPGKGMQEMIL